MQGTRAFRVASRTRAGFRTRDAAAGALRSHHGCRGWQELGARRNFAATILREIVTGIIHPADRRCPKTPGFLRGSAKNGGVSHPLRQLIVFMRNPVLGWHRNFVLYGGVVPDVPPH